MKALLHSVSSTPQQAPADLCLCQRLLDTHRQVWVNLLWGHCSFLLSPGEHKFLFVLSKCQFPSLWESKFWWLYVEANGDLLLVGLCHTQACCSQSPCPCGGPLLANTSAGDTQTQFCLSLCGALGPGWAQGLFEPSEHLWRVWGLILNPILSLLLSFWGFCFALGRGLSHHSRSSTTRLPLQIT